MLPFFFLLEHSKIFFILVVRHTGNASQVHYSLGLQMTKKSNPILNTLKIYFYFIKLSLYKVEEDKTSLILKDFRIGHTLWVWSLQSHYPSQYCNPQTHTSQCKFTTSAKNENAALQTGQNASHIH